MAAKPKQVAQAKTMAAAGKSAQQIQNRTGVSSNRASNLVTRASAGTTRPMPGGPSMVSGPAQTQGPLAPGVQSISGQIPKAPSYNNPVQQAVGTYGDWNTGGKAFGSGDIKALQQQGMNPNQIMKIAAGLGNLEGGRISERANTMLTAGFSGANKGRGLSDMYFANTKDPFMQSLGRQQGSRPKKELKWGGMTAAGKPMALSGMDFTKDPFGTGKAYTWTPGKGLSADGLTKKSGKDEMATTVTDTTDKVDTTTAAPTTAAVDETLPLEEEKMQDININMPGVGSDIFSLATGWKSKKSRRASGGPKAQGLASQRVSPTGGWQYNIG